MARSSSIINHVIGAVGAGLDSIGLGFFGLVWAENRVIETLFIVTILQYHVKPSIKGLIAYRSVFPENMILKEAAIPNRAKVIQESAVCGRASFPVQ